MLSIHSILQQKDSLLVVLVLLGICVAPHTCRAIRSTNRTTTTKSTNHPETSTTMPKVWVSVTGLELKSWLR